MKSDAHNKLTAARGSSLSWHCSLVRLWVSLVVVVVVVDAAIPLSSIKIFELQGTSNTLGVSVSLNSTGSGLGIVSWTQHTALGASCNLGEVGRSSSLVSRAAFFPGSGGDQDTKNAECRATSSGTLVYVAGVTQYGLTPAVAGSTPIGGFDGFLAAFHHDQLGIAMWARVFGSVGNDEVKAMAQDAAGNAYVVGYVAASISGHTYKGGETDAFVIKYSPQGVVQWSLGYGSFLRDEATAVALGSNGQVYVLIQSGGSLDQTPTVSPQDDATPHTYIAAWTIDGVFVKTHYVSGLDTSWATVPAALSIDSITNDVVVGGSVLSPAPTQQFWTRVSADLSSNMAPTFFYSGVTAYVASADLLHVADDWQQVIVGGSVLSSLIWDPYVRRYDVRTFWNGTHYNTNATLVSSLAVDKGGNSPGSLWVQAGAVSPGGFFYYLAGINDGNGRNDGDDYNVSKFVKIAFSCVGTDSVLLREGSPCPTPANGTCDSKGSCLGICSPSQSPCNEASCVVANDLLTEYQCVCKSGSGYFGQNCDETLFDVITGTLRVSANYTYSAAELPVSLNAQGEQVLNLTVIPSEPVDLLINSTAGGVGVSFLAYAQDVEILDPNSLLVEFGTGAGGADGDVNNGDADSVYVTDCLGIQVKKLTNFSAGVYRVSCTIQPGFGDASRLVITRVILGVSARRISKDTLTFGAPLLTTGTLRRAGRAIGEEALPLVGYTLFGEDIEFDGSNLWLTDIANDFSSVFAVHAGPRELPYQYECAIFHSTFTNVKCTLPTGVRPDKVFFTLTLGNNTATFPHEGDAYVYPQAPLVSAVRSPGCTDDLVNNVTRDCPTMGGVLLTISGQYFYGLLRVTVASLACPLVNINSEQEITCILPAGTGEDLDVRVNQGNFASKRLPLLSYARPTILSIFSPSCISVSATVLTNCPRNTTVEPATLHVLGMNLGPPSPQVLVGQHLCTQVSSPAGEWHTAVQCSLPSGNQLERTVLFFSKAGTLSLSVAVLSYAQCPAGTYETTGSLACKPCGPGAFSSVSGSTSCTRCDSGFFAEGPANTTCAQCPAGSFYLKNTSGTAAAAAAVSSCSLCGVGRFSAASGQAECTPCPAGRRSARLYGSTTCEECGPAEYQDSSGASVCLPCPNGTAHAITGRSSCPGCKAGFFSNDTGLTQCLQCPAGTCGPLRPVPEATSCKLCPPGTYSLAGGASCTPCKAGQASRDYGASACVDCPAGSAQPSAGHSVCVACETGRFSNSAGQVTCSPCGAGTYQNQPGKSFCSNCPAGSYIQSNSSDSCTLCAAGSAQASMGQSECLLCPPGQYAAGTGRHTCLSCPPGFAAPSVGTAQCLPCGPGQYAPLNGTSVCLDCAPGTVSNSTKSDQCVPCPAGFYSNGGSRSCAGCPSGKYAPRPGSAACFACPDGTFSLSEGGEVCHVCPPAGAVCAGGVLETRSNNWAHFQDNDRVEVIRCVPGRCLEGNRCAEFRKPWRDNIMCGQCVDGYTEWNDRCVACTETNWGLVTLLMLLAWGTVLVLHVLSQRSTGSTKVFLYFVQTAMFQLGPVEDYLSWLSLFNFNGEKALGAVCVAPLNAYERTAWALFLPWILLAQLLATVVLHYAYHRVRQRRIEVALALDNHNMTDEQLRVARAAISEFALAPYLRTLCAVLLFSYTQVTVTCVNYLYCVRVGDAEVMWAHPSVNCADPRYKQYLSIVGVLLGLDVVGLPLGLLCFLWRFRSKIQDIQLASMEADARAVARQEQQSPPSRAGAVSEVEDPKAIYGYQANFRNKYGILFESYTAQSYFWELVALLRRTVLIVMSVALVQDTEWQLRAYGLFNLMTLVMHVIVLPFKSHMDNVAETTSLTLLVVLSLLLGGTSPPYPTGLQVVIFIIVAVPSIIFIAFFLFRVYRKVRQLQEDPAVLQSALRRFRTFASGLSRENSFVDHGQESFRGGESRGASAYARNDSMSMRTSVELAMINRSSSASRVDAGPAGGAGAGAGAGAGSGGRHGNGLKAPFVMPVTNSRAFDLQRDRQGARSRIGMAADTSAAAEAVLYADGGSTLDEPGLPAVDGDADAQTGEDVVLEDGDGWSVPPWGTENGGMEASEISWTYTGGVAVGDMGRAHSQSLAAAAAAAVAVVSSEDAHAMEAEIVAGEMVELDAHEAEADGIMVHHGVVVEEVIDLSVNNVDVDDVSQALHGADEDRVRKDSEEEE